MSFLVGGTKRTEVDIDITMNGLANNAKRISAQYSYLTSTDGRNQHGASVYPLRGWLEVGVKFASNPAAGTLDVYILPGLGDDGSRLAGGVGTEDAAYTRSVYECHYVGSFHNGDLGTGQRIYTFNLGVSSITGNNGGGNDPATPQPERNRDISNMAELPAFWSVVVHNNATSVALAETDNYVKFTPVFDFFRTA